jgi:hypothetical protein
VPGRDGNEKRPSPEQAERGSEPRRQSPNSEGKVHRCFKSSAPASHNEGMASALNWLLLLSRRQATYCGSVGRASRSHRSTEAPSHEIGIRRSGIRRNQSGHHGNQCPNKLAQKWAGELANTSAIAIRRSRNIGVFNPAFRIRFISFSRCSWHLDDRFHESCHKGGIHLCLEAPIYGSVALGRGVKGHGSVAAGDMRIRRS